MKKSIAKEVFELLEADPYSKQAIKLGIANYSAIAKRIKSDYLQKAGVEAIKAAVRRYAEEVEMFDYFKDLKKILKGTKIALKSDIAVVRLFPKTIVDIEKISNDASIVRSMSATTIILDQEHLEGTVKIVGKQNIQTILKNYYIITLISPEGVESTPGFVAFVTELLARNELNIQELYSCYTDTVFVLEKKDALRAYELLDRLLG